MDTGQEPGHEPGLGGSHSTPVRGLVLKHVSHTTPGIICLRQTQSELITNNGIVHLLSLIPDYRILQHFFCEECHMVLCGNFQNH